MHIVTLVKIYIEIALLPFLECVVASYVCMFSVTRALGITDELEYGQYLHDSYWLPSSKVAFSLK